MIRWAYHKLHFAFENRQKSIIDEKIEEETILRTAKLSYLLAFSFGFFGLTSTEYLKNFIPELTFWQNMWPRLVLNVGPFLLLGVFIRRIRCSFTTKIVFWTFCFSIIIHAAAWIYVWPIAMSGRPSVFFYVHASNIFVKAIVFIFISPPPTKYPLLLIVIALVFWFPLFYVVNGGGRSVHY